MFRQKLSAIGMLVVGFLAGCAANLVARDLTAAKIGVVGDLVEWPRDSDGRPLPRSTDATFPFDAGSERRGGKTKTRGPTWSSEDFGSLPRPPWTRRRIGGSWT